jgi:hypothetical protein
VEDTVPLTFLGILSKPVELQGARDLGNRSYIDLVFDDPGTESTDDESQPT